jgi:pilus assembly protein Flp/PilA
MKNFRGQALVEYGILVALIAVVVIGALVFLGPVIAGMFTKVTSSVNSATPA